jgi:hypothetical protein
MIVTEQKIAAICELRGISREEFQDSIAEDLGGGMYRLTDSAVTSIVSPNIHGQPSTMAPRGRSASAGPGAELKRLLSRVGIHAAATCACNARAAQMDRWGPDECENRLEEIVGWLQEEHAKRAAARETILPFSKLLAANIVKLAIRRARRNEP